ncbi:hypothetical protein Vqi01_27180 [Micromonospora qiuiae]|uniref:MFS transporter n=1 Tax=Micromonospora qiuiae TaxID=502268 RepID=A0ABQ4JBK6_9ACTN|nr:hypothetical protein Vqi01_27180 [Micromonospora qiuiae]
MANCATIQSRSACVKPALNRRHFAAVAGFALIAAPDRGTWVERMAVIFMIVDLSFDVMFTGAVGRSLPRSDPSGT